MAKRRTSGIQRRTRASDTALSARLDAKRTDWRLLAIAGGGLLAIAVVTALAIVSLTGGSPTPGKIQPDGGASHIADGTDGGPSRARRADTG